MAQLNKVEEITSVWNALASQSQKTEGWMTLPVATGMPCLLKAGRHSPGNEEAILAGFKATALPHKEQLPEGKGFSVRIVSLGQEDDGRSWIALQRQSAGSLEMFTMMAADIVTTLESMSSATESQVLCTFIARIRAWQKFMYSGKAGVLGFESEVGLFGELSILEGILNAGISAERAVNSWVGPCDGLQDFTIGTGALEVKTTTAVGHFPAWISSLEQLDDSLLHPLFLAAVRICQADSGVSLPDKIEKLREKIRTTDLMALLEFDLRLLQAGYFNSFSESYVRRFEHVGARIIPVNDNTPRLVRATVPSAILRAKYEMDIESISADDLSLEQALHSLGAY